MARAGFGIWQCAPRIAASSLLLEPPVERSLRLLEQAHMIGKAGLPRSGKRQALRRCIKGRGNRDRNVLTIKLKLGALLRKTGVPCRSKVSENERRRKNGRYLFVLRQRIRPPGQELRRAISRVMTQPGLCRLGDAPRRFAGLAVRQPADDPTPESRPRPQICAAIASSGR